MKEPTCESRTVQRSDAVPCRAYGVVVRVLRQHTLAPLRRVAIAWTLGAMAVLALPPYSFAPVLVPAFGGFFLLLGGLAPGAAALTGWGFGFGFFLVGTHWIAESFLVDAERLGWMAVPAVSGLGGLLAVFVAAGAWLFARLKVGGTAGALLFAAIWAGSEWVRGHALTGFPWNLAAYAWADHAAPRQAAAAVGSYGLSLLTVLAATLPVVAAFAASGRRDRLRTILTFVLVAVALGSGDLRSPERSLEEPSRPIVRIVQGNVPQAQKWRPEQRAAIIQRYLDLSSEPGDFDILLWPETAFPGFLEEDGAVLARLGRLLPPGTHLLAGTPRRTMETGGPAYWNTVAAIDHLGQVAATYAKHHLVPFGEYVPLGGVLPIERLTAGLGDFSAGPGPQTLQVGNTAVGLSICYEAIFPGEVVDRTNRPDWIFNATNDAWFGTSIGPHQHLASARMRAVEEGLPMARAANTGISAVIDGFGDVRASLPLGQAGIVDARLPPGLPPTPYARYGDLTFLLLLLGVSTVAWSIKAPGCEPGDDQTRHDGRR